MDIGKKFPICSILHALAKWIAFSMDWKHTNFSIFVEMLLIFLKFNYTELKPTFLNLREN